MATTTAMSPAATTADAVPAAPHSLLGRLTVEHLLYGLLTVVAIVARLIHLGAYPLAPTEAATALRAWQASQGLGPMLDAGSPLLFSLQTLTFFLAGATDGLARLWPLLASALLPWAIYGWRGWVGRPTALLAAALVTASPLLNAFGRRGDGAAFVLLGLALAVAGWASLQQGQERGWMLAAVGTGILLIGGLAAPAALIALTLVILLSRPNFAALPRPALTHLVTLMAIAFVGGTAFLSRLDGLGLTAINWDQWLQSFTLAPSRWLWGLGRLVVDDPLVVISGLVGLVFAWRRSALVRSFGLAALVVALLAILQGPFAAATRAVAGQLFALPAAFFLLGLYRQAARLLRSEDDFNPIELLIFAAVLQILVVLAALSLLNYTHDYNRLWLIRLGVALVAVIVFVALFAWFSGQRPTLVITGLLASFNLGLLALATTWGMAFDMTPPRYAALYAADTRPGIYTLLDTLGDLSERRQSGRWETPIALVTGSAGRDQTVLDTLHWYLRPARDLRVVSSIGLADAPPLVVAPKDEPLPLSDLYAGMEIGVITRWDPTDDAAVSNQQQLHWLIFRTAPWVLPTEPSVLWTDAATLTLNAAP
jgi:hypothetical protein